MNNKTKRLLLQYIKLNIQPIKIEQCKGSKCLFNYVIDADKFKKFIESIEVK